MGHTKRQTKIRARNQFGVSVVELLVALGLGGFIIGLTVMPVVKIKELERRVEFQSYLDIAHQVALQKSRNGNLLKDYLGIVPGNENDRCFGGRGTNCTTLLRTLPNSTTTVPIAGVNVVDNFAFAQADGSTALSEVKVQPICVADKCTEVAVTVETKATVSSHSPYHARDLSASFRVPAAALASRQEIDFSDCNGKMVTGINYATLKAVCVPFGGNNSCTSASSGPMAVFGNTTNADPTNCQPPVNQNCPSGMAKIGMINGQAQCAPPIVCTDPLSTNCGPVATLPTSPTITLPVCVPNWQPDSSTVCAGDSFTQNDINNCPPVAPRSAVGTNAAACMSNTCTFSGPLKWPDPVMGPCSISSANLTATSAATASTTNDNLGYFGNYTVTCKDNSPAPNTFDFAAATKTCAPITCSGVNGIADWSAAGMKAGTPGPNIDVTGPWNCKGPLSITQSLSLPGGILASTQADPSAKATASNVSPLASTGALSLTCNDPGPANSPRTGLLEVGQANCVASSCQPLGYETGNWGGADDTLCTSVSSHGSGLTAEPYATCCSGYHAPSYGATDTVGGGKCNWKCVAGPTAEPTPTCSPSMARLGGSCGNGGHPVNWSAVCVSGNNASFSWECASPSDTIIVPCPEVVLHDLARCPGPGPAPVGMDCSDNASQAVPDGTRGVRSCYTDIDGSLDVARDVYQQFRCDNGTWKPDGRWKPGPACIGRCFSTDCPDY